MRDTNTQKYMDAMAARADLLAQADEAFASGDVEKGKDLTNQARGYNAEIEGLRSIMDEEQRFASFNPAAPTADDRDRAEARADALRKGDRVTFDVSEVLAGMGLKNSTTLATGTLLQPTRVDPTIRDNINRVSSIVDQVYVQDLTGCQAILEPMLIADMEAQKGEVTTLAGTARTATDPAFDSAKIAPYEVNVTSFVDRNLARLTPVAYEEKIRSIAMRSLRRVVASLIMNGDGQGTSDMFGIKTAKSTSGTALYKEVTVGAIEAGVLDELVFGLGGDDELGGSARLFLAKADLKAIGAIRTDDGKRLYEIIPDAANPNIGRITDGGLIIPYTISSDLTSHATGGAGQTMLYGNPMNYTLGLFGNYSIRIDESVKAVERMNAILGDVFVGGNLTTKDGFVVAKKAE